MREKKNFNDVSSKINDQTDQILKLKHELDEKKRELENLHRILNEDFSSNSNKTEDLETLQNKIADQRAQIIELKLKSWKQKALLEKHNISIDEETLLDEEYQQKLEKYQVQVEMTASQALQESQEKVKLLKSERKKLLELIEDLKAECEFRKGKS